MDADTINVETGEGPSPEVVEMAGKTAVNIAEIEAARDVTLAEIHAKTVTEIAETDEDVEWLKAELAALHARCAALADVSSQNQGVLNRLEQTLTVMMERLTMTEKLIADRPVPPPSSTPESEVITSPEKSPEKSEGEADPAVVAIKPETGAPRRRVWHGQH